jgi:hypothetical protein
MKRWVCIWVLILLTSANGWCARKITVGQLEDLLQSLQQQKKSDAEIATALKQLELSQELTRTTMNNLVSYVPGPLSTEQIYVLEAKSANLIPPDTDLPTTPAPDDATQKAILAKAAAYINSTYAQLPNLKATKTTLRFQDNVEAVASSSGLQGGATDAVVSSGFSNPSLFVHYMNSAEAPLTIVQGGEKLSQPQDKTPWGANKMIALRSPAPNPADVWKEAQDADNIQWLRWELVNGSPTAVFTFTVPQKKSHLDIDVCCFPKINQTGIASFYTATTALTLGSGSGGGGVSGNFQTSTNWNDFKTTAAYHGELFVSPGTGVLVRLITQAEFQPSEIVHALDTRTDFGPARIGNTVLMVPVKSYVDTLVVPNGDSGAASYATRRTLFTSAYKDYAQAAEK